MIGKASSFPSVLCDQVREGEHRAHSQRLKANALYLQGPLMCSIGLRKGAGHTFEGWRLDLHTLWVCQCTQIVQEGEWYIGDAFRIELGVFRARHYAQGGRASSSRRSVIKEGLVILEGAVRNMEGDSCFWSATSSRGGHRAHFRTMKYLPLRLWSALMRSWP